MIPSTVHSTCMGITGLTIETTSKAVLQGSFDRELISASPIDKQDCVNLSERPEHLRYKFTAVHHNGL